MSKCPADYKWVKVPRVLMPPKCKGIMKDYFKIAFASAYRDGVVQYCGYENKVKSKQWVGGPAGLKRLLERRSRDITLDALFALQEFNYVSTFFEHGGKITIDVLDIILPQNCSIRDKVKQDTEKYISEHYETLEMCEIENLQRYAIEYNEKCYVNDNSGFICIPRNLTERLVEKGYVFNDADAFYDLYLHTVYNYENNPFSQKCPSVMYNRVSSVLTLDKLGERWGWSKNKVSRFFKKFSDYFSLMKLQSSYGCVIFNRAFQTDFEITVPTQEECFAVVNEFKARGEYFGAYNELIHNEELNYSENEYLNCCINNFMSFDPEEESYKATQILNDFEQRKMNNDINIKTEKSTFFSNYFFDCKNCVCQILHYNTLFDIRDFNNLLTAPTGIFSYFVRSSNNTLNDWFCPKSWTAGKKKLLYSSFEYYYARSPVLDLATPIPMITESNVCKLSFSLTAEPSIASPPRLFNVANIEYPKETLGSLIKKSVSKLKSKIKYLAKGVIKK